MSAMVSDVQDEDKDTAVHAATDWGMCSTSCTCCSTSTCCNTLVVVLVPAATH